MIGSLYAFIKIKSLTDVNRSELKDLKCDCYCNIVYLLLHLVSQTKNKIEFNIVFYINGVKYPNVLTKKYKG